MKFCPVLMASELKERYYHLVGQKYCRPQLVKWKGMAVGVPSTPPLIHINMSYKDTGLKQHCGVEIQLHHLSSAFSFHSSIPHTFHDVIDCQFPGLLFYQVSFFHHLLDRSSTLCLILFLFTSIFLSFSSSSLCTAYWLIHSLDLSFTFLVNCLCTLGAIEVLLSAILEF